MEIQDASEERVVSEKTPFSQKYKGISEDYKTCDQLDRLLFILDKKI